MPESTRDPTSAIVRTPAELARALAPDRAAGRRVGLVPTMGAIHAGHLSLVDLAKAHADIVVASVFVNPTQFAPHEDFDAYPRQEANDAELLTRAGCTFVYAPSAKTMYPDGFATSVHVEGAGLDLEAASRPHFFHGVATVVSKLFNQTRPDVAAFGEKDYQQLLVIRQITRDLDLGVEILAGETLREPDGLAMSSRNGYLDPRARRIAAGLNKVLVRLADGVAAGGAWRDAEARGPALLTDAGFDSVDYVAVRRADDLDVFQGDAIDAPARILAAARVAGVRLIDNMSIQAPG